ncbi:carbohydrate kinase family protein [Deinococcus reticulitermitis]|nr:carbohydrate kinase family protein [Deinococcus reticulitermitis]
MARAAFAVAVVGGLNMDFKARCAQAAVPATSNPGVTSHAPGGVGRNVAEGLVRLGVRVRLCGVVGEDALGRELLAQAQAAGVDVSGVRALPGEATGTYTALLDHTGDLLYAVADMRVMDALSPALVDGWWPALAGVRWLVVDGNLPEVALTHLLRRAKAGAVPVVFEPVSVPKAARLLTALRAGCAPHTVTPNLDELGVLVGRSVENTGAAITQAAQALLALGVQQVWVRRGPLGSLLVTPGAAHVLAAVPAEVVDVTGAGDALLAAFLAAQLAGDAPEAAARFAHAVAALVVASRETVPPELAGLARLARFPTHSPGENPC